MAFIFQIVTFLSEATEYTSFQSTSNIMWLTALASEYSLLLSETFNISLDFS